MRKEQGKKQKGVTLISLTIYIIVMLIVVTIIAGISLFFYNNVITVDNDSQNLAEFNKFNMYFLEETKKVGNQVASAMGETSNTITFSSGVMYTYVEKDSAIYRDKTKICENVKECTFTSDLVNGKEIVEVTLVIGNETEFKETIRYVVENPDGNTSGNTRPSEDDPSVPPVTSEMTITFMPNGNKKYEQLLSTRITITNGEAEIDESSLRYIIKTDKNLPTEEDFLQNGEKFNNEATINKTGLNGEYYIYAIGKDINGETVVAGSNVFYLDSTPPEMNLTLETENASIDGNTIVGQEGTTIDCTDIPSADTITITGIATDNIELESITCYVKKENGTYTEVEATKASGTSSNVDYTITLPSENGTYSIKVEVIDQAGNKKYIEFNNIEKKNNITHTVTYDYLTNGGNGATQESISVAEGENIDLTPVATKEGYTFIGWNTDKDAIRKLDNLTMGTEDITLYAIYEKVLTLTIKLYNGTMEIPLPIYNNATEATYTLPEVDEIDIDGKTYTIAGYADEGSDTISYAPNSSITISENKELVSIYQGEIEATFYYYNGTEQATKTDEVVKYIIAGQEVEEASIAIPQEVTQSAGPNGTSYVGVSLNPESTEKAEVSTANTTYYAYYQVDVTLHYYNGTSNTSDVITRNATSNGSNYVTTPASTLPTPSTYDGAEYKGWTNDPTSVNANNVVTFTDTAATTLYAYYQKTITVTYDANNGSGAPAAQSGTKTYISKTNGINEYSPSITLSNTEPTRTGYTFTGWNTQADGTGTDYTKGTAYVIDDNITLYAKWAITSHTLTVNPNGGTWNNKTETQTFTQDYGTTQTIENPTRNYTVSFDSNGGSTCNSITASWKFNNWDLTGAGTLTGTTYTYGIGNGTLTANWTSVSYKDISLPSPTKQGYIFEGWYIGEPGTGTKVTSTTDIQITSNVTLTANWLADGETKYTVEHYKENISKTGYDAPEIQTLTGTTGATVTAVAKNYEGFTYNPSASGTVASGTIAADGSLVLKLYYTRNVYNIDVEEVPGAEITVDGEGKYEEEITVTVEPKPGYEFEEIIVTDEDGNNIPVGDTEEETFTMPDKDVTITVVVKTITYTITYNLNGGSVSPENPSSYTVETESITLNNPVKEGYTFTGWTGSNGETPQTTVTIAKGSTGNKTYTANWQITSHTLTVRPNGGTWNNSTGTQTFTQNYGTTKTIANPTRSYTVSFNSNGGSTCNSVTAAWTFNKWDLTGEGTLTGTTYTYGAGNGTLTANWTGVSYKDINLPTTTKQGYIFEGWYIGEAGTGTKVTSTTDIQITSNVTLTANWLADGETRYTVEHYRENTSKTGYNTPEVQTLTGTTGATVTAVGKSYTGFTLDKTVTGTVASGTIAADGSLVLKLYYTRNTYTITYNLNGGTNNSSNPTSYVYGVGTSLANPTREGYTFTGWYTNSSLTTASKITSITTADTGNKTIYAGWNVNNYTVTYNYEENGGTSATKTSANVAYGSAIDLTPTASKAGYEFVGWNTNKDATSKLTSLTMEAGNVTIYAIYSKEITATVNYYNNQTTSVSDTIYNNATSATLTLPTIANQTVGGITYTGRGYSTSNVANGNVAVASGGNVTLSSNQTYYATYQTSITATFYYHGGTDQYASTQTSTTASGIRYMNSAGSYVESNITVPSAVTGSTGYNGTTYKGVSISRSSTTSATVNTANTAYYAYYQVNVTLYYYNGSSHTSSVVVRNATSNGSNYVASAASTIPTPSAYDGAEYKGWTNDPTSVNANNTVTFTDTAATTLYAYYQKTITVTYDANNGSGAPAAQSGTKTYISKTNGINEYSPSITLSNTEPTRTGYTFTGWNTQADGTGTDYTKGTAYVIDDNITLYAKWIMLEPPELTLTYIEEDEAIKAVATDKTGTGINYIQNPDGTQTSGDTSIYNVTKNGTYEFKAVDNMGQETIESIEITNIQGFITEWNIPANGTQIKLPISSTTNLNANVDWGDGTTEDITGTFPTHTYATAGTYDINITGTVDRFGYNQLTAPTESNNYSNYYTFTQYVTKVKDWGNIGATQFGFAYCKSLTNIVSPRTESFRNVTSFESTFQSCSGLEGSIPADLFANCPNVTSFSGTFSRCSGLTSIPAELFANNSKVETFYATFMECNGLTGSIPVDLFASCPNVTSFQSTFYRCSGLTSIPAELFANNSKVETFYATFMECNGLTGSIPVDLFASCPNVTSFQSTFSGCSGLEGSIPAELFANCPNVTTFADTFRDCRGLTGSIPEDLFANKPNVTVFEATFQNCSGLTGAIPGDLFVSCPKAANFSYTFNGCSGLEGSIPAGLFTNCPNARTFYSTFAYCSGLTGSIPAELFANNPNVTNFSNTFNICSGLEGSIPAELFANNPNVTSFQSTFGSCSGLEGSIPAELFANNPNVTSFQSTFAYCRGLKSANIDIDFIGNRMFYGCNSLTNITISDKVTSIGTQAFRYSGTGTLGTYLTTSNEVAQNYDWAGDRRNLLSTAPELTLTYVEENGAIKAVATDKTGTGINYIENPDGTRTPGDTSIYNVLKNGTYTFKAVDNMGQETSKSIEITEIQGFITEWNIPADNTQIKLPISSTTNLNANVDWGDGTSEDITGTFPTHTYATAGTYDINITGTVDRFGYNYLTTPTESNNYSNYYTFTQYVTKVKDWGNIGATQFGFAYCKNLTSIVSPRTESFKNVTSFEDTFYNCSGLSGSIPAELFANCPNVTTFDHTFSSCSGLTGSIPAELFANCPDVTTFYGTFYNCSGLSGSIPAELFANCPNVTSFGETFNNCSGLTGAIPSDLFANNPNVTSFYSTFSDCSGLSGSIPAELFANCPNVTNFGYTFYYCSGLSGSIPAELFANCPDVTTFYYTFYNCSGLSGSIPAELFANCPNVTTFYRTFGSCRGLTGSIPAELFANCPDVTTFERTFESCRGLTGSIPTELFANNPNVTNFGSTFSECRGLTGAIPANLFANCPNVTDFDSTFFRCSGLSGSIPAELFANNPNVTNFRSTFYSCSKLTSANIDISFIGDKMFWSCDSLTNITISDKVTSIGAEAFYYFGSGTLDTYLITNNDIAKNYDWAGDKRNLVSPEIYEDENGETAPIPDGFTVSEEPTEQTVENGLVVIDPNGNEWVWVPVDDINEWIVEEPNIPINGTTAVANRYSKWYEYKAYSGKDEIPLEYNSRTNKPGYEGWREPDIITGGPISVPPRDTNGNGTAYDAIYHNTVLSRYTADEYCTSLDMLAEQFVKDYNDMVDSVSEYHGFYIARYELTGTIDNPTVVSGTPISGENWYSLYNACTKFSTEQVTSTMIWGAQWQMAAEFINTRGDKKPVDNIVTSQSWGNYLNTDVYNSEGTSIIKESGEDVPLDTGITTFTMANNIYDFAGNFWEWTQTAWQNNMRVIRGGSSFSVDNNSFQNASAISNSNHSPNSTGTQSKNSTRAVLYLNTIKPELTLTYSEEDGAIKAVATDKTGAGINYIENPDGTITQGDTSIYNVLKNGVYRFKAVDDTGKEITAVIGIKNIQGLVTEWNIPEDNTEIKLPISSALNLYASVDWGDGTSQEITGTFPTHTYATAGTYDINITGTINEFGYNGYAAPTEEDFEYTFTQYVTKVKDWGDIGATKFGFSTCENLTSIASPRTESFRSVTSFTSTFADCRGLTSIPTDLFANCPKATNFTMTFKGCSALKGAIPESLFAGCPEATTFDRTFYGCIRLTGAIPSDLFANCSKANNFSATFSGCRELMSIPDELFANCLNVTDFSSTFSSCRGLTGNAPELWERTNVTSYSRCFNGCNNLSNYSSIPSDWK